MSNRSLSSAWSIARSSTGLAGHPKLRPALCLAALLAALTALATTPSLAGAAPAYVSLGDSYTAGPFILPPAPGAPLDCLQSARDYPHLTAAALGLSLTDVSCSGATTENLTTTAQYPDQPRQFNSLSSSTQVVSVGIGGNDKGLFLNTLITCGAEDLVFPLARRAKAPTATNSPKRSPKTVPWSGRRWRRST